MTMLKKDEEVYMKLSRVMRLTIVLAALLGVMSWPGGLAWAQSAVEANAEYNKENLDFLSM